MAKGYGNGKGAKGKQEVRAGSDCGAHEAFQKASSPASVKKAAQGTTPYKHR
jgi:hypothetical protein